jgi:hypothetical protein
MVFVTQVMHAGSRRFSVRHPGLEPGPIEQPQEPMWLGAVPATAEWAPAQGRGDDRVRDGE